MIHFLKFKKSIEHLLQRGTSFATYQLPNQKEIHTVIQYSDQNTTFEDALNLGLKGFVMHPFDSNSDQIIWLNADELVKDDQFSFDDEPTFQKVHVAQSALHGHPLAKSAYQDKIESLIEELNKGELSKVVFSRRIDVASEPIDVVDLFVQLTQKYPDSFAYLFNHPQTGLWIGASPEVLLRSSANRGRTMALAGTRHSGNQEEQWLEKEKEEQQIVQDHIENCLNETGIAFEKSDTTSQSLSSGLAHLKTEYEFEIPKFQIHPLLRKLHPTPAICGHPSELAKKWILQNEAYQRKYYTGFLGPVNLNQQMDLFVNLRCAHLGSKLNIFVGGGITSQSIPEKEWMETEHKSRTMLDVVESQFKI